MPYITLCNAKLSKRIEEINFSNEMLDHGITELEALYLRLESGAAAMELGGIAQAQENISLLNRRNHKLAHAINKALKEVESTLRHQMETGGMEIDKDVIHEFTIVLRESIRIFHEYRIIEEGYHTSNNNRSFELEKVNLKSNSSPSYYHHYTNTKRSENRSSLPIVQQVQRLMKTLCLCGAGRALYH